MLWAIAYSQLRPSTQASNDEAQDKQHAGRHERVTASELFADDTQPAAPMVHRRMTKAGQAACARCRQTVETKVGIV